MAKAAVIGSVTLEMTHEEARALLLLLSATCGRGRYVDEFGTMQMALLSAGVVGSIGTAHFNEGVGTIYFV